MSAPKSPKANPLWPIAVCALLTAPFPFTFLRSSLEPLGIPLWLWWSLSFTVLLSFLTYRAIQKTDWDEGSDPDE